MGSHATDDELSLELLARLFEGETPLDQIVHQQRQVFAQTPPSGHYLRTSKSPI